MRTVANSMRMIGTDRVRVHLNGVRHDVTRAEIEKLAADLMMVLASFARDDEQKGTDQ